MIYTMNGMVTKLNLRADNEGKLQGLSAHFSGDGFPDMMFDVNVISQVAFPDWVREVAKSDLVLNEENYTKLMQQSVEKGRPTYRLQDPRLFEMIASQHIPPGPGPQISSNAGRQGSGGSDAR
jgi:cytochrome o ubiquinol oxidase subunit 2